MSEQEQRWQEVMLVEMAIKARTEGMGVRATGRVLDKSHSTISRWEQRLAAKVERWSPEAPSGAEITIEGDEVYTQQRREPFPPQQVKDGQSILLNVKLGTGSAHKLAIKNAKFFEQGVKKAWEWAKSSTTIRWFTDGEQRYGKELWKLASVDLKQSETTPAHPYRKLGSLPWTGNPSGTTPQVWREGVEVAIKISGCAPVGFPDHGSAPSKGSQGRPRIEWVKAEHPLTAISDKSDVHANHNEAQNAALRRRSSAYRRRQNLYAKRVEGWQRALDVQRLGTVGFPDAHAETRQRLIHNWVRPHWSLNQGVTPAMAMGYSLRPFAITELLTQRGFLSIPL